MAARKAVSLLKYLPLMQPALVKSVLATWSRCVGVGLGVEVMAMPDQPRLGHGHHQMVSHCPARDPASRLFPARSQSRALDTAFSASPHTS